MPKRTTSVRRHSKTILVAVGISAMMVVAAGGGAVAANTIRSIDIVDGQVRSADIRNNDVQLADLAPVVRNELDAANQALGRRARRVRQARGARRALTDYLAPTARTASTAWTAGRTVGLRPGRGCRVRRQHQRLAGLAGW